MTREEAVRILNVYASVNGSGQCTQDEFDKAKRIAIKALEADSDDYARGYKQDMMNNLIRRQDAIDAIMKETYADGAYGYTDAKSLVDALESLPSAQPEPHWIPCSERLPEEETDVLVTRTFLGCKDGSHGWNNHIPPTTYVEVAQYFCGEWTALSDEYKVARNRHTEPVAWMELPEPWRGE